VSGARRIRADSEGLEEYVEAVVVVELERHQRTFTEVADTDELAAALRELEVAEADLEQMRNDTTARRRLGTRWVEFVEPYVAAAEAAQAHLDAMQQAQHAPAIRLTADAYRAMSRQERADALRSVIDCVFVRNVGGPRGRYAVPIDGARVRILWRGTGPGDLPSTNRASTLVPWTWPGE
jgi:hypothetical protein